MVQRALILLVALLTTSCASTATRVVPPADSSRTERTVRITSEQFNTDVSVSVGDVLVVERPADYDEWDISYASEILRSLNTAEGRRRPPADGWTFAVVGAGTTDISLTPAAAGGGAPNVPRFVVTITAR